MAKPVAPRFSRSFRRLCQVAALTGSDRLQRVLDGLIPVMMIWDDKRDYKTAADWVDAAREEFGLPLNERDVDAAFERAVTSGNLIYNSQDQIYELSSALRAATLKHVNEAEKLEIASQSSWLAEVGELVPDIPSDDLWNCLITYAGEMFLRHGYEAVALLSKEAETTDSSGDAELIFAPGEALYRACRTANIDGSKVSEVATAIAVFFNGVNSERVKYVTELADSTFNFMALGVDAETRNFLVEHLPNLTVFVDTNVIFDVVGAHETPLGASSVELFEIIRRQSLSSFRLYCHEKTLQETERTIANIGNWLSRTRWTPSLSRAILNASPDITSIELKYHQTNATVPTSPDVFLSRYSSMPALLDQYGIKIYRDPIAGTPESVMKRGELAVEYGAFIESHARRERPYEALDHDVTLWLTGLSRRTATGKGPLFSGALILSADYMFARFEREVLIRRPTTSGSRMVTQPSSLLQALRPFLPMPEDYDSAFVNLFSISPFRVIAPGLGQTVNTVASYLASYEGLPEEIATSILTNSILMTRLQHVDKSDIEFQRIIGEAVVDESRNIIRERDQLLEEQRHITENSKEVLEVLSVIAGDLQKIDPATGIPNVDQFAQRLKQLEEKVAAATPNIVLIEGDAYGVQAAGGDQTVTVNFAAELPAIKDFIEQFRGQLDRLPLSAEKLEEVTADLEAAEAQLKRPEPRPAILRAAVNSLREVVLGAAGSGAFAGLLELAQHIRF